MVLQQHNIWIQELISKNLLQEELDKFGETIITRHVDCEMYYNLKNQFPELYNKSLIHHKGLYEELVCNNLSKISIPDIFKITGLKLDDNTIVPHTAYRIGYNKHKINSVNLKNKKNIYLEIGGGFGLLAYLQNRDTNCCYIIVDIPNVGILSGFFLMSLGLKVCFYGEYDVLNEELFNNYDIIIIPPNEMENIPKNSCDFIINTASFTEMSKESIMYYIKQVNRIRPQYLYTDGHLNSQNDPTLQEAINNYLYNYSVCFKNKTPIIYDDPPILPNTNSASVFEERMYKNLDVI